MEAPPGEEVDAPPSPDGEEGASSWLADVAAGEGTEEEESSARSGRLCIIRVVRMPRTRACA